MRTFNAYLNLFHTEYLLFRVEMSSLAARVAKGLGLLIMALMLFLIAIVLLVEAAVAALTDLQHFPGGHRV
jgi:hypothetical protein